MTTRVGVIGSGLVGRRTANRLRESGIVVTVTSGRAGLDIGPGDVVVLATPSPTQHGLATAAIESGATVVATADEPAAIEQLWTLDSTARRAGCGLILGAAFSPGVSSLLVAELAQTMDRIDSITTARFGTGGPACAREHHRSMAASGWEVRQGIGRWVRGGSGRGLVWFPEPVGPKDCYRAGLAEPALLQKLYPQVMRIQSLQAATRRDRLTAHLPMLRPPHPEGLEGACWAEVRGLVAGRVEHRVLAALAPQATGAAAMAAAATESVVQSMPEPGVTIAAALGRPGQMLAAMAPQVRVFGYDGSVASRPKSDAPVRAARKRPMPIKSNSPSR